MGSKTYSSLKTGYEWLKLVNIKDQLFIQSTFNPTWIKCFWKVQFVWEVSEIWEVQGVQGNEGVQGVQGFKGSKGSKGFKGSKGSKGSMGSKSFIKSRKSREPWRSISSKQHEAFKVLSYWITVFWGLMPDKKCKLGS